MGGQNNTQPSMTAPQPQINQFDPRVLGYGQGNPSVANAQSAGGFGNWMQQPQQQQTDPNVFQMMNQQQQQQIPGMYAQLRI